MNRPLPAQRLDDLAEQPLEDQFCHDNRFERFCIELKEQFVELELSNQTLECLYDNCVDARVERDLIRTAREIMSQNAWRRSGKQLRALSRILQDGAALKVEERMRKGLGNGEQSRSRSLAILLSTELLELKRTCRWWEDLASSDYWKKYYAGYIWSLNKHLCFRTPIFVPTP